MSKIVKTISSLFITISLLNSIINIDFSSFQFNDNAITVDSTFIENRNEEVCILYENEIEKNLENNGYYNVKIDIRLDDNQQINNLYVDLSRLVLIENSLNINKYTNIMAIIKNIVSVKEEQIIFYE